MSWRLVLGRAFRFRCGGITVAHAIREIGFVRALSCSRSLPEVVGAPAVRRILV
jgi:hypothetical protein